MNIKKWLKDLEQRKIVSREPPPAIPFILSVISLSLGFWFAELNNFFGELLFWLAGFTLIFAIIHWYVWSVLKRE